MEQVKENEGFLSWPEPVRVLQPDGPLARLTGLPESRKRVAWKEIQTLNPALAALLREQPLQQAVKEFGAEIFIEAQYAPSLPLESLKGRAR